MIILVWEFLDLKVEICYQNYQHDDFSKETFKFGDGKYSNINKKKVWIQRLSYVGELGYEIYSKIEDANQYII